MKRWRDEETVFLLVVSDTGEYFAQAANEHEVGKFLAEAIYGVSVPEFTIWDVDSNGQLVECTLVDRTPLKFDENDYTDMQVDIVQPGGKIAGTAFARIDGRA